jgi:hypothetical protein
MITADSPSGPTVELVTTANGTEVPMVVQETSVGRVIVGPEPSAYQHWEQQREER